MQHTTPWTYGFTFILVLVIIVAGILIISQIKNRKVLILKSRKRLGQLFIQKRFDQLEQSIANALINVANISYASNILTNRKEFNRAVNLYMHLKMPHFSQQRKEVTLDAIKSIRHKNGFDKHLPFKSIGTTKEIAPTTQVSVQIGNKSFKSTILENKENYLIISLPTITSGVDIAVNKKVVIRLFEEDNGHYEIKTNIVKVIYSPHRICLKHTHHIPLPKQRKEDRIKVYRQTQCEFSNEPIFKTGEVGKLLGIVTNLSTGGLEMHAKKDIPIKSFIKIDIPTSNSDTIKDAKLQMLKKRRREDYFIYNFRFLEISNKMHQEINSAIQAYGTAQNKKNSRA